MKNEEFDIIDLIMKSIETDLSIPCFLQYCDEDLVNPYVIFKVTSESENNYFDRNYLTEDYQIEVTLWYTSPKDTLLYKRIINKLKEENFKYKKSYDIFSENMNNVNEVQKYLGKLMIFSYKRYLQ